MNKRIRFQSHLNRRSFIARAGWLAGAACAGPMIVPARVLGLEGTAPSNRITIGFIGTGRQATYANIPAFLNEEDAQCVAVCDTDSWRMEQARKRIDDFYAADQPSGNHKSCGTFRDWRDLIARKDIDAVMISTPDHWHVLMAVAAARAGKAISCEKPLTRSVWEGRVLSDTVAKHKVVFRTDSEYRSRKFFFNAIQAVRNGRIGKLERVITATPRDPTLQAQPEMPVPKELDYEMWLGPAPFKPYTEKRVHTPANARRRPGWICIRDYADGMIANWGAHLNDMAIWAMDLERTGPVEVRGTGKYPPKGNLWDVILDFEVHYRYANGMELICKTTEKPYVRYEGSEGWIQVNDSGSVEASNKELINWKPGPEDLHLTYKRSEKRDFLDAIKTSSQPLCDAEVGHRNTTLCHLGLAAIELGRPFKWDPVKEKTVGDEAAEKLLAPKPCRAPWKLEA